MAKRRAAKKPKRMRTVRAWALVDEAGRRYGDIVSNRRDVARTWCHWGLRVVRVEIREVVR